MYATIVLEDYGVKLHLPLDLLHSILECEGVDAWYLMNTSHPFVSQI